MGYPIAMALSALYSHFLYDLRTIHTGSFRLDYYKLVICLAACIHAFSGVRRFHLLGTGVFWIAANMLIYIYIATISNSF